MQTFQRPVGKIRNPGVVILLIIVTLGIYGIVWHYSVLEELKRWRGQGWSGGMYLVFTFLLLSIPNIVLPWLLPSYVGNMYAEDGKDKPITGLAGFWIFLPLVGGIVWFCVVQSKLNSFWQAKGAGLAAA